MTLRGAGTALALAALLAAGALGGCGPAAADAGLTVLAAASLGAPLERIRSTYADRPLTVTTDSSTALRTQVEQGAQGDVFLSADRTNPEALAAAGLTDGPPVTFATNRLTIAVPPGNPARIEAPADLARPGVRVIAAGEAVPISRYAVTLVANLGIEAGYTRNVVSREDNVAAVVAKIALGEGDAAIVYATDAAAAAGVESIGIPGDLNVEAPYVGVVIAASHDPSAGHRFLDWLTGPDGQRILRDAGFAAP